MSSRSARSRPAYGAHGLFVLVLLLTAGGVGCWEQWSETWFPQMKWQKAVQAFERVPHRDRIDPFSPPEGTVPVDGEAPALGQYDPAADEIANPTDPTSFKSLNRGQELYVQYCETCHGRTGMGDGPVSATGDLQGPFGGVFPLVTAQSRSDGYIYNLIRAGGNRMPGYQRIPVRDRWHIVNYVRYLQKGGQP